MTGVRPIAASAVMSDEAMMLLVCARNDAAAFGELVMRWQQRIRGLCLRLTGCPQDADDATQETFCRAYAARNQFKGQAAFSTWLWRIALNSATDLHRKRRPEQTEPQMLDALAAKSIEPQESLLRREVVASVVDALQELPEELRTIVVLRHYQGLKFREIGELLDLPQGTVCSRMSEGLTRLSRLLHDE